MREKIALVCNVGVDSVIAAPDVDNIYRLPMVFSAQDLDDRILSKLGIWAGGARLQPWQELMDRIDNARYTTRIGIVGKYVAQQSDAYLSLRRAITHAAHALSTPVCVHWIDTATVRPSRQGAAEAVASAVDESQIL